MATQKQYFVIVDCPGPFRLVAEWVHLLEEHGNRFVIELTVEPFWAGEELLGHDRRFSVRFEAALAGATTKYGHGINEPRNVRLLGRFPAPCDSHAILIDPEKAAPELEKWQWEVVFNPQTRKGFVAKLDKPLPEDWTL